MPSKAEAAGPEKLLRTISLLENTDCLPWSVLLSEEDERTELGSSGPLLWPGNIRTRGPGPSSCAAQAGPASVDPALRLRLCVSQEDKSLQVGKPSSR